MPRLFLYDGEHYRPRTKPPLRDLTCLFGPIALRRFCYQPLETCGRCLFPLEIQLGIVTGVATPALADAVSRARAEAAAVADAMDMRLGPALRVRTDSPRQGFQMRATLMETAQAVTTPVAPGQLTVSATVTITSRVEGR